MAARKHFLNSARTSMRGYGAEGGLAAVRMVAALDGVLLHELLGVNVDRASLRNVVDSVEQWVTAGPKRARGNRR